MQLNTRTKLIALLGLVLAASGAGFALLRLAHRYEAAAMSANLQRERADLVTQLIELNGHSLQSFANDYSYWDDMLTFATRGDREWARVNIEASLPNFDAHAAWVWRTDGSLAYGVTRQVDKSLDTPPFPIGRLIARLRQEKFAHFFARTPSGLMEVRVAPLQPSTDAARSTPPHGWFAAGRIWDEAHLQALRDLLRSEVQLRASGSPPAVSDNPGEILFGVDLPDWQGAPLMRLETKYRAAPLAELLAENYREVAVFVGFGVLTFALTAFGITRWVVRPLRDLEQGLLAGSPAPLVGLCKQNDEFGRLANLVVAAFRNRQALEDEVVERRRVETDLRAAEDAVRQAADLRVRLGRDLHDSLIQSIYAAGLGIESAQELLRTDPKAAETRLDATRLSLNQTIADVREFILGLEPELRDQTPFADSLRTLVATLQSVHTAEFVLNLPPASTPLLDPRESLHALQIVRECVSNALRHGDARRIAIDFSAAHGRRVLSVSDNGRGFDRASVPKDHGNGLANMAARAQEINATLDIDSAPAKGTRVTVTFPQNSSHVRN